MALQGTLDTFELSDVLRLLASTRKSGRLHLRSDRGEGTVWMTGGLVVRVEAGAPGSSDDDGLFELLRGKEGAFGFDPEATFDGTDAGTEVEPMLMRAEAQLAEWRTIEAVVPSMDAWVSLAPELAADEVTVDAATWRLVATIGSGLTVSELGRALDLPEVPVCRLVRDLTALSLASVSAAPAASWTPAHAAPAPTFVTEAFDEQVNGATPPPGPMRFADQPSLIDPTPDGPVAAPAPAAEPPDAVFTVAEPVGYATGHADDAAGSDLSQLPPPPPPPPPAPPAPSAADDEVSRQIAMLSPRAAQAVAAMAAADPQTPVAGNAGTDADDDGVDRSLLLKFLSSVKT